MKYLKLIFIGIASIGFSACSPFAGNSSLLDIGKEIDDVLTNKSAVEIVAGGTKLVETNPGVPSQNYKVTSTIGQFVNQAPYHTPGGYIIQSTTISQ